MTTTALAWTAKIVAPDYAFQTLQVKTLALTMDEAWAPSTQATLTVAWSTAIELLDPERSDILVDVTATQATAFHRPIDKVGVAVQNIDSVTAFNGYAIDALAAFANIGFDSGTTDSTPDVVRTWRLVLREIAIDYLTATATLTLASPEARLQDWALVQTTDLNPPLTYTAGMVPRQPVAVANYVLALIGETLSDYSGLDDAQYFTAAQLVWKPGTSAFDYAYQLFKKVGLLLYCRYDGNFVLRTARLNGEIPTLALDAAANIKTLEVKRSREIDYYTAAVVTYSWADSAGTQQTAVDAYDTGATPKKVYTETVDRPYPGAGVAANIIANMQQVRRTVDVTAVANLTGTWLANAVTATHSKGTISGSIRRIEFQHPSDEMVVTIRQGV